MKKNLFKISQKTYTTKTLEEARSKVLNNNINTITMV